MLGELESEGVLGLNLGGTSFLTTVVLYINIVYFSFHNTNNKTERLLFTIYLIIALTFIVFYSFKASAILLALLTLALQYFAYNTKKSPNKRIVAIVLVVFFAVFFDKIMYIIVNVIGSERVADRLLLFTKSGGGEESTFGGRSALWTVSINSWLKSFVTFLFGIGDHPKGTTGFSTALSGIGRHSEIFDTLARYGLVGFFIICSMFSQLFKYLKQICNKLYNSEINMMIIIVIITALTKLILYPDTGFILFFLLPLCIWNSYINRPEIIQK
jgi:hypothetical protein